MSSDEAWSIIMGAKVSVGLAAQGHITLIDDMLGQGRSWDEIGQAIGWDAETARQHYDKYAEWRKTVAVPSSSFVKFFVCWCDDECDESDGEQIEAVDAMAAAREYHERKYRAYGHDWWDIIVKVRDVSTGELKTFACDVEYNMPSFNAREIL